jgi:hypothetical protein
MISVATGGNTLLHVFDRQACGGMHGDYVCDEHDVRARVLEAVCQPQFHEAPLRIIPSCPPPPDLPRLTTTDTACRALSVLGDMHVSRSTTAHATQTVPPLHTSSGTIRGVHSLHHTATTPRAAHLLSAPLAELLHVEVELLALQDVPVAPATLAGARADARQQAPTA